ncbi:VOC family protein [Halalkalicoccus salilacus]|uniref:VOC family protein n=1 Tax=Halalkalicoccus TaxID=332246 RepID=UPI002F969B6E
MEPTGIDHFVLTVSDVERSCGFYERVLGCEVVTFGESGNRRALRFGDQKINLHPDGWDHEPKAERPTTGAGDFCVLTETPIRTVVDELRDAGVGDRRGPRREERRPRADRLGLLPGSRRQPRGGGEIPRVSGETGEHRRDRVRDWQNYTGRVRSNGHDGRR